MADERLRLVAEVQDQFTGPLDKLNASCSGSPLVDSRQPRI